MAPIISVVGFSKGYGTGRKRQKPIVFNSITFTNGVAIGATGPYLNQGRDGITATFSDNSWILDTSKYITKEGVQYWTVPKTGIYRIETYGANGGGTGTQSGGFAPAGGLGVGKGSIMRGDFSLTEGDVLKILVGQSGSQGLWPNGYDYSGGGGGGTFVSTFSPTTSTVLIVSGGGGGGVSGGSLAPGITTVSNAPINPWGNDAHFNPTYRHGGGGINGGGGGAGAGRFVGAGGGSLSYKGGDADAWPNPTSTYVNGGWGSGGNAANGNPNNNPTAPLRPDSGGGPINGGKYAGLRSSGENTTTGHPGGFGGGGASGAGNVSGGGGGGYSGGGGGGTINVSIPSNGGNFVGGGGGSYNSGINQFNIEGLSGNNDHGKVKITLLFGYDYPEYDPPIPTLSDVFSDDFWTGDGNGSRSIINGINLEYYGGMVWVKDRVNGVLSTYWHSHFLSSSDTLTTANLSGLSSRSLSSNNTSYTDTSKVGFLSNGFNANSHNQTGGQYVGYTFRKSPKFFDSIIYAGTNGSQIIKHGLRSVPGCIIIKNLTDSKSWVVMHHDGTNYRILYLNSTSQANFESTSFSGMPLITNWDIDSFTVDSFTSYDPGTGGVGDVQYSTNRSNNVYQAFLFATDNSLIKCGSWSGNTTVNLGWQPQWIMYKKYTSLTSSDWYIHDSRLNTSGSSATIRPNTNAAETTASFVTKTASGFQTNTTDDWIYIAIGQ